MPLACVKWLSSGAKSKSKLGTPLYRPTPIRLNYSSVPGSKSNGYLARFWQILPEFCKNRHTLARFLPESCKITIFLSESCKIVISSARILHDSHFFARILQVSPFLNYILPLKNALNPLLSP